MGRLCVAGLNCRADFVDSRADFLHNGKHRVKFLNISTGLLSICTSAAICAQSESSEQDSSETDVNNVNLEEVRVLGSQRNADYTVITQGAEKLVETAGALGDPLGAIFALPGVVYSGSQEPAVRGSSPDDNIFIVDFLPASYIFHEFGVSVFSEHILHDFQMYSAGFGPEYGGVTGAVFDVKLREPKNQPWGGILDLSMLRSGILLEGAVTENSALYVSARRSMLEYFINEDDVGEDEGIRVRQLPRDIDYQVKYSWNVNDYHRFSLTANGASDSLEAELTEEADFVASNPDFEGDARLDQSYEGVGVLWEYAGESGTEWKLGYNQLQNDEDTFFGDDYRLNTAVVQQNARAVLSVPLGTNYRFRVGGQYTENDTEYDLDTVLFVCTEFDPDCDLNRQGRLTTRIQPVITENFTYMDLSWIPTNNLVFDLGVQLQSNDFTEEEFVHPRVGVRWQALDSTAITFKAGRYNRFPDLDTVLAETGNPDLQSPLAEHFTLGMERGVGESWSLRLEAYYKELTMLPRSVGADEPNPDLRYVNGTEGTARGIDLMVNKNRDGDGKWWGWMTLSYAASDRTNLLTEETKEYFLDTPFIFNWVLNYQITDNLNLGGRWSVRSGQAYTPIVGVQDNPFFEDSVLPIYGDPFSDRLPIYNRLDFRLKWDTNTFGLESALILDVINALNIENITNRELDYDRVETPDDEVETVDTTDIGLIPALTYRIIF